MEDFFASIAGRAGFAEETNGTWCVGLGRVCRRTLEVVRVVLVPRAGGQRQTCRGLSASINPTTAPGRGWCILLVRVMRPWKRFMVKDSVHGDPKGETQSSRLLESRRVVESKLAAHVHHRQGCSFEAVLEQQLGPWRLGAFPSCVFQSQASAAYSPYTHQPPLRNGHPSAKRMQRLARHASGRRLAPVYADDASIATSGGLRRTSRNPLPTTTKSIIAIPTAMSPSHVTLTRIIRSRNTMHHFVLYHSSSSHARSFTVSQLLRYACATHSHVL